MSAWWMVPALLYLAGLCLCALTVVREDAMARLVAFQLAASAAAALVVVLALALNEPPFWDIAIALALLNIIGTLTFARFLERWL
jgi:multisubunit Na+/H+ antiporter MnhF subunit